jgi:pimeloyl-ACP methyl ester carboxylesterase
MRMKKISILIIVFCLLFSNAAFSQHSVDGRWAGSIGIMGSQLVILVSFNAEPDSIKGTIDIPQQNALGIKLIHIAFTDPKIYFELQGGPGLAVFDGILQGDSINGKFTQAGIEGTFILKKRAVENIEVPVNVDTLPYKQEEVSFSNGDNTFAGTLTIPKTKGKHPAVVMITGSGPQNRDEELFNFKPFGIIADYFTRHGIAVLRYDDRGVGGSKGKSVNESTTEDFAGDVLEAVKYLKTRDDINPDQIGLCGHSEGGIVAPLVASKSSDVDFIICIAGSGVKGIDLLIEQSKLIMKADGESPASIKERTELLQSAYNASITDTGWGEVEANMEKVVAEQYNNLPDAQKKSIKDKDEYIKVMTQASVKQFHIPWMKFFMSYDPIPALKKVKCPVLLVYGEKDLQVPPAQNKEPMENALKEGGNKDYKVVVLPNANHLFLYTRTGSPEEYANLPKEFVPGFLDTMTDWILKRVTVVK